MTPPPASRVVLVVLLAAEHVAVVGEDEDSFELERAEQLSTGWVREKSGQWPYISYILQPWESSHPLLSPRRRPMDHVANNFRPLSYRSIYCVCPRFVPAQPRPLLTLVFSLHLHLPFVDRAAQEKGLPEADFEQRHPRVEPLLIKGEGAALKEPLSLLNGDGAVRWPERQEEGQD